MMSETELPNWDEVSAKEDADEWLNPIEQFVYDNEPTNDLQERQFRDGLTAAIDFALSASRSEIERLREALENALVAMERHVEWEADVILNADWSSGCAHLHQEHHDRMTPMQEMRNKAINKARSALSPSTE